MIKEIVFISAISILLASGSSHGQTTSAPHGEDISKFDSLLKDVVAAMDTSTDQAFVVLVQLKKIAKKIKIDTLSAKVFDQQGLCNYYAGNYKKAILYFDSAVWLWKNTNGISYGKSLNRKGNSQMYNSEYYNSLLTFFESLSVFEKIKSLTNVARTYNNIGLVYESIGDWNNSMLYAKKSLKIKVDLKDSLGMANSYGNIGNVFFNLGGVDSCIYYQRLSLQLNLILKKKIGVSNALGAIGNCFREKNMPDSSIAYLIKAAAISKQLGNTENNAAILNNLGLSYLQKGDLKQAYRYAMQTAAYVAQITDKEFLHEYYQLMYRYYEKVGDTPNAFNYLKKLKVIDDSLSEQKINIQSQKLAVEYEYKQKNLKDSLVFEEQLYASENKATASKNQFVIAALLLLLTASVAAVWYNRVKLLEKRNTVAQQNTILQAQQIKELESEKQLLASQAILKGQEDERGRLARDLHDGLGGLLSSVKHSIINMKEKFVLTGDHVSVFEKSLDMIDTSIKELRRVAQNMMPEALAKFGLQEALKDYCATVSTPSTQVVFQSFGENATIKNSDEIIVYRIIQELVNNVLKHASASEAVVQLINGAGWIKINVEDNGKGFNIANLQASTGSGWSNLKSRVDYLKGNIDLKSEVGSGTSVSIELKIVKE